jgi:hypothetical protein
MFSIKQSQQKPVGQNYKWVALSNTTLAIFMTGLDGSCVMIALPAIFRGNSCLSLKPPSPLGVQCS